MNRLIRRQSVSEGSDHPEIDRMTMYNEAGLCPIRRGGHEGKSLLKGRTWMVIGYPLQYFNRVCRRASTREGNVG